METVHPGNVRPATTGGVATWPPRFGWLLRTAMVLLGLVPIVLLIVAWRLTPDPSGLGTHQQLGLMPCTMRQMFGIRCPSCGMTTSWSYFMRGDVLSALRANTGGTLLAIVAAVGGPWLIASGVRGRWIGGEPSEWWFAGASVLVMIVTLLDWTMRIYFD